MNTKIIMTAVTLIGLSANMSWAAPTPAPPHTEVHVLTSGLKGTLPNTYTLTLPSGDKKVLVPPTGDQLLTTVGKFPLDVTQASWGPFLITTSTGLSGSCESASGTTTAVDTQKDGKRLLILILQIAGSNCTLSPVYSQ